VDSPDSWPSPSPQLRGRLERFSKRMSSTDEYRVNRDVYDDTERHRA
jgi:hypothetical protein